MQNINDESLVRSENPNPLVAGPLMPAILRIAGPVLALEVLHIAYHLVDLFWVGHLGAAASAALTTALFATWIMTSLMDAVGVGIVARVARALGGGDVSRAGAAAAQGVLTALACGLVFAFVARPLAAPLFQLLGVPPDVAPLGATYLGILFASAPALFLMGASEAIWRATGDTMTPLRVVGASTLLNAVLDPLLIFGIGPFPRLGIAGAAWATAATWILSVAFFVVLARRTGTRFPLDRPSLVRPRAGEMLRTLRIGLPRFLIGSLFSGVYLALSSLVSHFGTAALAVLGIVNRLESMVYVAADAIGVATATMVGQNLGADQAARANRAAHVAAALGVGLSLIPTVAMLLIPEALVRPFSADREVLRLVDPYLRIIGLCQAFMMLEIIFSGGFSGAGDTLPPMLVELPISAARVPLAWLAAYPLGLGLDGVAWVLSLTCIVRGGWIALWFRTGRWKHRKV